MCSKFGGVISEQDSEPYCVEYVGFILWATADALRKSLFRPGIVHINIVTRSAPRAGPGTGSGVGLICSKATRNMHL